MHAEPAGHDGRLVVGVLAPLVDAHPAAAVAAARAAERRAVVRPLLLGGARALPGPGLVLLVAALGREGVDGGVADDGVERTLARVGLGVVVVVVVLRLELVVALQVGVLRVALEVDLGRAAGRALDVLRAQGDESVTGSMVGTERDEKEKSGTHAVELLGLCERPLVAQVADPEPEQAHVEDRVVAALDDLALLDRLGAVGALLVEERDAELDELLVVVHVDVLALRVGARDRLEVGVLDAERDGAARKARALEVLGERLGDVADL